MTRIKNKQRRRRNNLPRVIKRIQKKKRKKRVLLKPYPKLHLLIGASELSLI
jgi:hypothetical protein